MKTFVRYFLPGLVLAAVCTALAFAQVVPGQGITRAIAPLKRVGSAVEVDTNGSLKVATVRAVVGTFGTISVGTCTGCGSGGGGSGGTVGQTTIDPRSLGTLKLWLSADVNVYSDTACSAVVTTGGTVACWVDRVNGLAFKNSTAGGRPTWLWNRRANHPTVVFGLNGEAAGGQVATALTATSAAGVSLASFTECAVVSPEVGISTANDVYDVFSGSVGTLFGLALHGSYNYWQGAAPYAGARHAGGYVPNAGSGRPSVACSEFDAGTLRHTIWVDGSNVYSVVQGGSLDYTGAFATLGATPPSGANAYFGEIDELLEWDSALSPAVIGSAFTYERARWNIDGWQGGGGSSGGSGMSDPIVVNGWTPASGTATITGAQTVTGASATGAQTVTGNSHITGNLTVDGAISGVTPVGGSFTFVGLNANPSGQTNEIARMVIPRAITLGVCYWSQETAGSGIGNCNYQVRLTGGATQCSVTQACNSAAGTMTSTSCAATISASANFSLYEVTPALASGGLGQLSCGYTEAP